MKKLLLLCFSLSLGCGAVIHSVDSGVAQCYIGMPTSELKKIFRGDLKLEKLSEENTIYYVAKQYRTTYELGLTYTKFFYFKNDKLFKIDEGQRATDQKIVIEKTIKRIE